MSIFSLSNVIIVVKETWSSLNSVKTPLNTIETVKSKHLKENLFFVTWVRSILKIQYKSVKFNKYKHFFPLKIFL